MLFYRLDVINLKQTIPDNIEDIDSEIDKKDKIYNYMAKIYNNNLIYH